MIEEKINEEILKTIAPCSLFCTSCTGCTYGNVSYHAQKLLYFLEGHEEFLDQNLKNEYRHKVEEFNTFKKKLKKYAYPKRSGCRDKRASGCSIKECIIPKCTKEHNVDFCAECPSFPCNKVNTTIYSQNVIYSITNFIILNDKDKYIVNGIEYEFFDILAKGTKQFGFACLIEDKRFIFLGDEPLNAILYERVKNADYVTHEAFCLDSEENIFHAYEKNHSTALSASKKMNELNVKNLILYHTEESHGQDRKDLYLKEAQSVFKGNVLVPDDLEEIIIS